MLSNKCFRRKCAKFDAAFVPLAKRHIGNSFHGIILGGSTWHFVLNIYYFLYLRRVKIKRQIFLRLLQRLTALSNERPHYPVLVPEAYLQLVRMNVYVYLFGRYSYMQHCKREPALHKARIIRPLKRIGKLLGTYIAAVYIERLCRARRAAYLLRTNEPYKVEIPVIIVYFPKVRQNVVTVNAGYGAVQFAVAFAVEHRSAGLYQLYFYIRPRHYHAGNIVAYMCRFRPRALYKFKPCGNIIEKIFTFYRCSVRHPCFMVFYYVAAVYAQQHAVCRVLLLCAHGNL